MLFSRYLAPVTWSSLKVDNTLNYLINDFGLADIVKHHASGVASH